MKALNLRLSWLLAYPFRLFFTVGALWAIVSVGLWMLTLQGVLTLPQTQLATHWHAHEMLHGFASVIIAGFLLTAMANWTGLPPATGYSLLGLVLIWFAGRLALMLSSYVPEMLIWTISPLFYLALAGLALHDLIEAKNRRNLVMPVILLLLALSSGLMTWGGTTAHWSALTAGTHLSLYTLTLLMAVVAGRITPAFTRNWLASRQKPVEGIRRLPWLEWSSLGALVALAVTDLAGGPGRLVMVLGLGAGVLHLGRLWLWRGWRVAAEPLLGILHLGYLCLALSIAARGLVAGSDQALSLWYHLVGMGAMGILIIGVMTRVAMGHTGRPLTIPVAGLLAYLGIVSALIARLLALIWPELGYMTLILMAGFFWSFGFAAFIWGYLPILTSPRPDGRPG